MQGKLDKLDIIESWLSELYKYCVFSRAELMKRN
jgi:hypothetical protein